jgi:hypothetical protein
MEQPGAEARKTIPGGMSEPELSDDRRQLMALVEVARREWKQKRLSAERGVTCWKEDFAFFGTNSSSGEAEVLSWEEAARGGEALFQTLEEVVPIQEPPRMQIDGPLALICCGLARCRTRSSQFPVHNLFVAARRDGNWRFIAAVAEDWRSTPDDRFRPENEEHHRIQKFLEQVKQAIVKKDADLLRSVMHPSCMVVIPDGTDPDNAAVYDRDDVVESLRHRWSEKALERHHKTIRHLKVMGPFAITLTELHEVVGGKETKGDGGLDVLCRTSDGWKAALWLPGDWKEVLFTEESAPSK